MLRLENWMSGSVISCDEEDSVKSAVKKMVDNDIGCIVVMKGDSHSGIVTENDIMKKVVGTDKTPEKTKIKDVMTTDIITLEVQSSLLKVSDTMARNHLRRIPLTKNGRIVGILTARDLLKIMSGR